MKKLLNTLYNMNPNVYLALDGENIVARMENEEVSRRPLHNFENIITTGYSGASPALIGKCVEKNISVSFLKQNGRFLAKVTGKTQGNVLLRRTQYRMADDEKQSLEIAKSFIIGKIYNGRSVVERAVRDYKLRLDVDKLKHISKQLNQTILRVRYAEDDGQLRGYEGEAAKYYFSIFDDLILQQKDDFIFQGRNKRPPLDNVNALLSYFYTILGRMCSSALETVGLDPYVGFMHTDRPGRESLALDLMEELRHVMVDRFVLTLINKKMIKADDFYQKENGAMLIKTESKKAMIQLWEDKKKERIMHPFLREKIEWGLVPYVQALILARYIRGDINAYPPFMWK